MPPSREIQESEQDMFEALGEAVKAERKKIEKRQTWLSKFRETMLDESILSQPWLDKELIIEVPTTVPKTAKFAGVDGGLISEAMAGFDLALYRAVAAVFKGVGERVEAEYVPNFDPTPEIFFSPSLQSRQEFSRISTLMRLYSEYKVAKQTISSENPTIIFLDGKVTPLSSDFGITQSKMVSQAEMDVKQIYRELVKLAFEEDVLLCGVVKDSRARDISSAISDTIPELIRANKLESDQIKGWRETLTDIQDMVLGSSILEQGERTAWYRKDPPVWISPKLNAERWVALIRPISDDQPVRIEIMAKRDSSFSQSAADICLGAIMKMCSHGIPISIPTIIMEADERTKLTGDHLEAVVDQISLSLGIPKDKLRKRRNFSASMSSI